MGEARRAKLRGGKRDAARRFFAPQRQVRLGMANAEHIKPGQPRP